MSPLPIVAIRNPQSAIRESLRNSQFTIRETDAAPRRYLSAGAALQLRQLRYALCMPTPLSEHDVRNALLTIAGWHVNGKALERLFRFPDFKEAMVFVNKIADAAEEAGHHPDITITYNKVTLTLISHDSGGVTERDVKLAGRINEIAG